MLIFLRDTDVDGQPIIGQGLLIRDETPLAVARAMQSTSPFNYGDLAAYMRRVLAAAGDDAPLAGLPGETPGAPTEPPSEAAAREFLERLARRGLLEFHPDPADAHKAADAARPTEVAGPTAESQAKRSGA